MRISSSAVAVLVSALALAACTGGGTSSGVGPAATGAAMGKPHYGGTLKIGSTAAADTVLSLFAHTEGAANDLTLVYDPLVNVDPNLTVVPWLAQRWDVSKDGLTYTFHLRHDAVWSDGVPITSADQKFEYDTTTNPATSASYKSDYDEVTSCTAPDKWTVVYTLKHPDSSFLANTMASFPHAPLPKHILGAIAPADLVHYNAMKHFVSSGPYFVSEWKPDDHMTLTSNKRWWHGRPYIDTIYVKEYQNETALLIALRNGDVDMGYRLTTPQWQEVKNDPKFTHIHNYSLSFNQYVPNLVDPLMGDLAVRKAIMYGYDRNTEANKLFHGEDIVTFTPIPMGQKWASSPAALTAYPYDVPKAKQLLDADGWTMGPDGYRHKNGQALTINVGLISGNEVATRAFELFQADMKDIGIKLIAKQKEFNVFFDDEQHGKFQLDAGGFQVSADPDPFGFLDSKAIPPNGLNYSRYSSPAMDALIEQAREATDVAKRKELYAKIQDLVIADVPNLYDVEPYYRSVVNGRIKGVDPAKAGPEFQLTMFYEPEWWVGQ